jgi:hypothetical protein
MEPKIETPKVEYKKQSMDLLSGIKSLDKSSLKKADTPEVKAATKPPSMMDSIKGFNVNNLKEAAAQRKASIAEKKEPEKAPEPLRKGTASMLDRAAKLAVAKKQEESEGWSDDD